MYCDIFIYYFTMEAPKCSTHRASDNVNPSSFTTLPDDTRIDSEKAVDLTSPIMALNPRLWGH